MKELSVAAIAIKRGTLYFMQHREGDSNIGAVGLIGFFGGKIEENEEPEAAARRELEEEAHIVFPKEKLAKIGQVVVMSDYNNEPVTIKMIIYEYELPLKAEFLAKEGKVVTMTEREAFANINTLTPGTRAFFETYKGEKNNVPANRS